VPQIIAHRGYSALYRENAPSSWQAAVAAVADLVEVDVRMTADGVLVCAHDADLRLAGHPGIVADMPAAEIAEILAAGEAVAPLLSAALAVIPETTGILFDVKDESLAALTALRAVWVQHPRRRLVFGLHSLASVKLVRSWGDAEILGLLNGDAAEDAEFFALGGDVLRLWESKITTERLDRLRQAGHPLWMTSGGKGTARDVGDFDAESLPRFHDGGISGFLVNDPVLARQALA
jgi:glycerophosphoryl diester phosphodiesterase